MLNSAAADFQPFLFASVVPEAACQRCFDTGVWLSPKNEVLVCPRVQIGERHAEPNYASILLRRATNRLFERQYWIAPITFDVARILTNFNTQKPCPRRHLEEIFFADTKLNPAHIERRVKAVIEELRKDWLLPIGSRKGDPSGYWIITDLDDFKEWFAGVKSAPIQQLATIHKVARHNFPVFAEQMEMDFLNCLKSESEVEA
jgi:hypothetical protein